MDRNKFFQTSNIGPVGLQSASSADRPLGPTGPSGASYNPSSFWGPTGAQGSEAAPIYDRFAHDMADRTLNKIRLEISLIEAGKNDAPTAKAKHDMANRCRYSWGVPNDFERSLELYRQAAEFGHAGAGYELARIFLQGYESKGIAKNPQKAQQIIDMTLAAARLINPKSIDDDNYNHAFSIEQLEGLAKAIAAVARMTSSSNSY